MEFDYKALRGRIAEQGYTQKTLAPLVGFTEGHLSQKMNGAYYFNQKEIANIARVLGIAGREIPRYFFTAKV